jgi:hypothetical protein
MELQLSLETMHQVTSTWSAGTLSNNGSPQQVAYLLGVISALPLTCGRRLLCNLPALPDDGEASLSRGTELVVRCCDWSAWTDSKQQGPSVAKRDSRTVLLSPLPYITRGFAQGIDGSSHIIAKVDTRLPTCRCRPPVITYSAWPVDVRASIDCFFKKHM